MKQAVASEVVNGNENADERPGQDGSLQVLSEVAAMNNAAVVVVVAEALVAVVQKLCAHDFLVAVYIDP